MKKNQHAGTMEWTILHSADIIRCSQLRGYEGYYLYAEQGISPLVLICKHKCKQKPTKLLQWHK